MLDRTGMILLKSKIYLYFVYIMATSRVGEYEIYHVQVLLLVEGTIAPEWFQRS